MHYIGIDLGGTKIMGALFNANGEILFEENALLNKRTGKEVGKLVVALCKEICVQGNISEDERKSIGICVPGIAYSTTGRVWAPNIPGWDNYPLRDELTAGIPNSIVTIESDRTCYILGETLLGAAKGCSNAIFIAVGTGIGAGIMIDGHVLHGHSDIVGAIGWMALKPPYDENWDKCGCFESHASGVGLADQAGKILGREISTREVFDAYSKNDPIAVKVINQAIEMWGMATANLVSLFNPEIIVFGGGVFGPATTLIDKIYDEACRWAQPISIKQVKFVATQLPKQAGLYGAGALSIRNSNV